MLVLAAGLTMLVNYNSGKVAGKSASLVAEDYPVGTDYSGTITQQYVHVGDHVAAGQPLFEVESASLERDLAQGLVNKDNLTHEVKDDNTLVITATNAGQVDSIAYASGAFVPANSTIATVQQAGTMYVEADFLLSAKDYARIPAQADIDITLPNNQQITAQVQPDQGQHRERSGPDHHQGLQRRAGQRHRPVRGRYPGPGHPAPDQRRRRHRRDQHRDGLVRSPGMTVRSGAPALNRPNQQPS